VFWFRVLAGSVRGGGIDWGLNDARVALQCEQGACRCDCTGTMCGAARSRECGAARRDWEERTARAGRCGWLEGERAGAAEAWACDGGVGFRRCG
jgi:hypothetical protein